MAEAGFVAALLGAGLLFTVLLLHERKDRARERRFLAEIAKLRGDIAVGREASEASRRASDAGTEELRRLRDAAQKLGKKGLQ